VGVDAGAERAQADKMRQMLSSKGLRAVIEDELMQGVIGLL